MTTTDAASIHHLTTGRSRSATLRHCARLLGQPLLLAATGGGIAYSIDSGSSLALASLLILLAAVSYLFAMERWIPFERSWRPNGHEWRRDTVYFTLNGAVSTATTIGVGMLAIAIAPGTTGLPFAAELPFAYLVYTFCGYWTHRLGHDVGALWQLHGVHHTPDKVNTWNNNVIHFLDLTFQNTTALLALLLLGCTPEAVFAVTAFSQVMGFLDHANADFRMGPLNYLIGSPEQHRLHHSTVVAEAGNYSSLPLWDLLFGTFTWRAGREPRAIGIEDPASFPTADSIAQNAVHPFRRWLGSRQ
ncbi:MAG: sterol desaturase family protein [Planctomycetes bacterium]|nr:sterol desaturase family protein [Planctomycetota bacterium]